MSANKYSVQPAWVRTTVRWNSQKYVDKREVDYRSLRRIAALFSEPRMLHFFSYRDTLAGELYKFETELPKVTAAFGTRDACTLRCDKTYPTVISSLFYVRGS